LAVAPHFLGAPLHDEFGIYYKLHPLCPHDDVVLDVLVTTLRATNSPLKCDRGLVLRDMSPCRQILRPIQQEEHVGRLAVLVSKVGEVRLELHVSEVQSRHGEVPTSSLIQKDEISRDGFRTDQLSSSTFDGDPDSCSRERIPSGESLRGECQKQDEPGKKY
jgi:hypothetical protein